MVISMLKIRRPLGRLIFNMGIAIPGKTVFLIETVPCFAQELDSEKIGLVIPSPRPQWGAVVVSRTSRSNDEYMRQ